MVDVVGSKVGRPVLVRQVISRCSEVFSECDPAPESSIT